MNEVLVIRAVINGWTVTRGPLSTSGEAVYTDVTNLQRDLPRLLDSGPRAYQRLKDREEKLVEALVNVYNNYPEIEAFIRDTIGQLLDGKDPEPQENLDEVVFELRAEKAKLIDQLQSELATKDVLINEQSKTITTLCLAIDPGQHGPETTKIAAYAEHNRKTAAEAKMGVILKCGSCNGLGKVYCYRVQDHIEYKECSTCGGTGINDDATKKIFELQSELAELRKWKESDALAKLAETPVGLPVKIEIVKPLRDLNAPGTYVTKCGRVFPDGNLCHCDICEPT